MDLDVIGKYEFEVNDRKFLVEVIDSVEDYKSYMKEIFDFAAIKELLTGNMMNILVNALHGGKFIVISGSVVSLNKNCLRCFHFHNHCMLVAICSFKV